MKLSTILKWGNLMSIEFFREQILRDQHLLLFFSSPIKARLLVEKRSVNWWRLVTIEIRHVLAALVHGEITDPKLVHLPPFESLRSKYYFSGISLSLSLCIWGRIKKKWHGVWQRKWIDSVKNENKKNILDETRTPWAK